MWGGGEQWGLVSVGRWRGVSECGEVTMTLPLSFSPNSEWFVNHTLSAPISVVLSSSHKDHKATLLL